MLEQIKNLLADFEMDKALLFLMENSERQGTIQRLSKTRNESMIRYELELLLQNPKIYENQVVKQIKVYAVENTIDSLGSSISDENTEMSAEYPDHYPEILVWKLKEANRLVMEKARLSNSLHQHPKRNKKFEVDLILQMSDEIGEIYKVKKEFDRTNRLPVSWLAQASPLEVEKVNREKIAQDIKNLNSRISKLDAKLLNPTECKVGKPQEWRDKRNKLDLERAKLKLLIGR